jgi:hypothetical protein
VDSASSATWSTTSEHAAYSALAADRTLAYMAIMLSKFLKAILYFFSLAVGTGIFANAARTPPEEAVENWAKWFRYLGINTVPAWAKSDTFQVVMLVLGAALVLAGLAGVFVAWRRKRDLGLPLAPIFPDDGYVSLQEACTRTYETFRKHGGRFSNAPDELSTDGALGWCASFLMNKDLPFYGTHPPSRERERIPDIDLGYLLTNNSVTEMEEIMSSRNPIWKDSQVRVEDLETILEGIKRDYKE